MAVTARRSIRGLTAGYLFISLAVSILIAFAINKVWYILPIFLILVGAFVLALSIRPASAGRESRSARIFVIVWGGITAGLGGFLVINDLYPNNLPILVALFLIFIGAVSILAYATRR